MMTSTTGSGWYQIDHLKCSISMLKLLLRNSVNKQPTSSQEDELRKRDIPKPENRVQDIVRFHSVLQFSLIHRDLIDCVRRTCRLWKCCWVGKLKT